MQALYYYCNSRLIATLAGDLIKPTLSLRRSVKYFSKSCDRKSLLSRQHFAIPAHLAFNHASYSASFRPFLSTAPAASPSYSPSYYPRTDVSTPYLQAQYQQGVRRCQVTTPQLELSETQWQSVAHRCRFCHHQYRERIVLCLRCVLR
jgi:hypothetical protein